MIKKKKIKKVNKKFHDGITPEFRRLVKKFTEEHYDVLKILAKR